VRWPYSQLSRYKRSRHPPVSGFFFSSFFPLARFCRLSLFLSFLSPSSALFPPSCCHEGDRADRIRKNVIKIHCRDWNRLSSRDTFLLASRGISSDRNCPRCFLLHAIYDAQPRAFGFSRVTRASAARAWCSLRAQWAVSLCGCRMTLLHGMECSDVIPVAILERCNDLH